MIIAEPWIVYKTRLVEILGKIFSITYSTRKEEFEQECELIGEIIKLIKQKHC